MKRMPKVQGIARLPLAACVSKGTDACAERSAQAAASGEPSSPITYSIDGISHCYLLARPNFSMPTLVYTSVRSRDAALVKLASASSSQ